MKYYYFCTAVTNCICCDTRGSERKVVWAFCDVRDSHSGCWSPYWVHSACQPLLTYCTCDCEDGEFGGMKNGRGNRSTRRKPAPEPLCPPQIPFDQTWAWTGAATVGSQHLTAWAMAWPDARDSDGLNWSEVGCASKSALVLYVEPVTTLWIVLWRLLLEKWKMTLIYS
jgi:hypothetical protein